MTVITKPLSEKKNDKLDEPLVENIHVEHPQSKQADVEKGNGGNLKLLVIQRSLARKSSSATTICLFLTAILVMSCGIIAGIYLYRQFALAQMHRFRGWCRIPYDDGTNAIFHNSALEQDEASSQFAQEFGMMKERITNIAKQMTQDGQALSQNFFQEEFEINADEENYEKITVPDFSGGRNSRFIHDFNSNKTGIIDVDRNHCFVMPLNRSQVLPPVNLVDLVRKMWSGYYEVDTSILRETMRVVLPPVRDASQLGVYIQKECSGYPIYMLEKVSSKVYKRSPENSEETFTVFAGKTTQIHIANLDELQKYEAKLNAVEES